MLLSWYGTSHTIGEYVDALNLTHIFFSHSYVTAASLSKCFIAFLFFYPPPLRLMHLFNAETL